MVTNNYTNIKYDYISNNNCNRYAVLYIFDKLLKKGKTKRKIKGDEETKGKRREKKRKE
jgi:hypothetical protein